MSVEGKFRLAFGIEPHDLDTPIFAINMLGHRSWMDDVGLVYRNVWLSGGKRDLHSR